MAKPRILYITEEITPYLPDSANARLGRDLPVMSQGGGYEVRIFMPRFGTINERRNQLHEVIRLSGMNISIADTDHPLIIKVASMHPSRIQVYFVDNDDYFQRLASDSDPLGTNRADNDERAIFFTRGTMETVRKLQWDVRIVHCMGWMSALSTLYLRRLYDSEPARTRPPSTPRLSTSCAKRAWRTTICRKSSPTPPTPTPCTAWPCATPTPSCSEALPGRDSPNSPQASASPSCGSTSAPTARHSTPTPTKTSTSRSKKSDPDFPRSIACRN